MANNHTRQTIYKINELATEYYQDQLYKSKEAQEYLKQRNINNIGIIIGAEGGFLESEAEELNKLDNVCCVSLGERILRAETAAINLLSILIYEMEE